MRSPKCVLNLVWTLPSFGRLQTYQFCNILGDPGADSWVTRKSKRPSLHKRKRSPWDSTLNQPVPKPIKILVCDWAQNFFCAQSESSPFRVTFVISYSKERCSLANCLITCAPYLSASCRRVNFPRSRKNHETEKNP